MDRLESMTVFAKVAESGSFTAAAKALGVPLANVSRKVAELEAYLGAPLLLRTTRTLALTDSGARYLAATRQILDALDSAEQEAKGEYLIPRGELVLTAPVHFGQQIVVPIVAGFLAEHPQISARLQLSDGTQHLIDDHLDLGIRIGALTDSSLHALKVGSMRLVTAAAPSLLAEWGRPTHPDELTRLPIASFERMAAGGNWLFRDPANGASLAVAVRPRFYANTAAALLAAGQSGIGAVRQLHYQVAGAVAAGTLELILSDYEPEPLPVHLVFHQPPLPVKTRSFIDYAAGRLRQVFADLA